MKRFSLLFLIALLSLTTLAMAAPSSQAVVTVKNPLDQARTSETIVLDAADLRNLLPTPDVRRIHVREEGAKQDSLIQAVDLNDDGKFEQLLFQTDMGPRQTKKFVLSVGEIQHPRLEDFKAYGRFARERRDDFAWENDRIAHRMYGPALETWAQEPLTSSAVDVWAKRVRRMVINDWYLLDNYHHDNGTGADLFSAGPSRGCGGNGLWIDGKLYPSANFRNSRVIATGPIRVMFELIYDTWNANGVKVSEVKRITLDAGQNMDRFESSYKVENGPAELTHAIGIRKTAAAAMSSSREQGWLRTWEPLQDQKKPAGELGMAIVADPSQIVSLTEDKGNYLITAKVGPDQTAVYYAGFGWTKSGDFSSREDWDRYVAQFAARLRAPLQVTLAAQ